MDTGHASVSKHCLTILTDEQSVGLKFIVTCSFLSLLAVLITLVLYIGRVATLSRHSPDFQPFLRTDIDIYFLSLLFADMLVAISGILNLKWINERQSSCGGFCSAQGGLEHIGTPAVALSTLAIALHTFFVIFCRWTPPRTRVIGFSVLTGIWTFLFLLVLIPALSLSSDPSKPPFYTPSPVWCYIAVSHIAYRAGASYVFAWIAAISSGVVYVLLFFHLRGAIRERRFQGRATRVFPGCLSWRRLTEPDAGAIREGRLLEREMGAEDNESEARPTLTAHEAWKMLYYPVWYIIIILPISATRWTSFTKHSSNSPPGHEVPFWLTAAAASLFKLGGVVDVLLFAFTRPNILLSGASRTPRVTEGTARRIPNPFEKLKNWSNHLRVWKSRNRHESRGGAETNEMEMQDIPARSETGHQTRARPREEDNEHKRSRIHPASFRRDFVGVKVRYGRAALSPSPSGTSSDRREPLTLDLNEEFDYGPVSNSATSLGSPQRASPVHLQASSHTNLERFRPLELDLPNPRISGLSCIIDPWISAQREERLAFLEPPHSMRDSTVGFSQTRNSWGTANANVIANDSATTRAPPTSLEAPGKNLTASGREEVPKGGGTGGFAREYSASKNPASSGHGKRSLGELTIEDPFGELPASRQSTGYTLPSRERRVRGPRAQRSRKSSSTSDIPVIRSRPARPTIGIPSSTSLKASPSPQSSTRSPRMRLPQSALEAIPEHRLLDSFQTASSHSLQSIPPTSPLSFRNKRPSSRPRSLSVGATPSEVHEARPRCTSFIDMS